MATVRHVIDRRADDQPGEAVARPDVARAAGPPPSDGADLVRAYLRRRNGATAAPGAERPPSAVAVVAPGGDRSDTAGADVRDIRDWMERPEDLARRVPGGERPMIEARRRRVLGVLAALMIGVGVLACVVALLVTAL